MPSTAQQPIEVRRSSAFPALVLGVIVGLLVALLAVPAVVRHVGHVHAQPHQHGLPWPARTPIDISRPTVIASIQRLARLESVVYTMDKVVEGNRSSEYLPDFLTGDKLLLVVHGQAVAGVDLRQVQASGVEIDGRSVIITMPAAELLSVSLDNSKTRVYSRTDRPAVPTDQTSNPKPAKKPRPTFANPRSTAAS